MFEVGEFVKIKKNVIDLGKKYKFRITEVKEALNPACMNVYKIERDRKDNLEPIYGPYDYQLKKIYEIEDRFWREDELEPWYGVATSKIYIDNGLSSNLATIGSVTLNDVKLTVDNPIYDYYKNLCEKEKNSMDILKLYKERKNKEIEKEYHDKKEELLAKDTIQNIINEMMDQVNAILESEENSSRLKMFEQELLTKDTEEKLKKLRFENDKKYDKVNKTIEEVEALFTLTTDYKERMKILEKYGIIKNGKINI